MLKKHGMDANKRLGQHFLVSAKVVNAIEAALAGCAGILEIGPGPGVLTQRLSHSHPMTALEVDSTMLPILAETAPAARVVRGDALTDDLAPLLEALPAPRGVVSNLPYYITGPLLDRIFGVRRLWSVAVLMMQREVGEKILAKAGDRGRGALSVLVEGRFEVKRVTNVPAGAFLPPPKVESIVLQFVPKDAGVDDRVIELARIGFTQPRKTLSNNLRAAELSADLVGLGLSPTVRPHELTLDDWVRLAREIN